MEEAHATHKDAAWGWFAVLLGVLDGFPRARSRPRVAQGTGIVRTSCSPSSGAA